MVEEDEGRVGYVKRRLSQAQTTEELEQIERDLIQNERVPRGTVSSVKSEMKKNGDLPGNGDGSLSALRRQFPQRLGRYDVLTPEAVLEQLRLQDGDYKIGFVDGIAMLLLAARLNQELATTQAQAMSPMIQMLQALRQEEREAAERAKSSSYDIAHEAAHSAVSGVVSYLEDKLPKGPPPKDMNEMFTKRLDRMWELMENVMEQKMFPGAPGKPPEGWEYEHLNEPESQSNNESQNSEATPQGWQREQVKEEENDGSGDVRSESTADAAGEGSGPAPQDGDPKTPEGRKG